MEIEDGGKKLEKLNLRISESERDLFERARIKAGFPSVSAWARRSLADAAEGALKVEDKQRRDIAVYLAGERISFGTDFFATGDPPDEQFDVPIPKDAIVEGHVIDAGACKAALREGFRRLRGRFDLSKANVLVTSRLLPSTMRFVKDMIIEASGLDHVFLIEFSMANAIGIDMDVHSPDLQPIVCVEKDWIEFAEICGAGLKRQRSMAWPARGSYQSLKEQIDAWSVRWDGVRSPAVRIAVNDAGGSLHDGLAAAVEGALVGSSKAPAITGVRRALPTVRNLFPDAR